MAAMFQAHKRFLLFIGCILLTSISLSQTSQSSSPSGGSHVNSEGWQQAVSGTTVNLYGVSFSSSSIGVTVGNDGTILRSTSGGTSWNPVQSPTQSTLNAVVLNPSGFGCAVGVNSILISGDNGLHWGKRWIAGPSSTIFDTVNNYFALTAVSFPVDSVGYACGFYADVQMTIPVFLKSTDHGETWSNLQLSFQDSSFDQQVLLSVRFITPTVGYVSALAILDTVTDDSSSIYTLNEILKTTDGGMTWKINVPNPLDDYVIDFLFTDNSVGYGVGGITILKTIDASAGIPVWLAAQNISGGVNAITTDGDLLYCVGTDGNILSSVNGTQWNQEPSEVTAMLWDVTGLPGIAWTVGNRGTILYHYGTQSGTVSLEVQTNRLWNIVSLPLTVTDSTAQTLFPQATSGAFCYIPDIGYQKSDTLHHGIGYWMKFDSSRTQTIDGLPITTNTIDVKRGWNLIGSITPSVPVTTILHEPTGLTTGNFYEFINGYRTVDTLAQGKGYWVKASIDGRLIFGTQGKEKITQEGSSPARILDRYFESRELLNKKIRRITM